MNRVSRMYTYRATPERHKKFTLPVWAHQRAIIEVILCIALFCGGVAILLFHPFFHVTDIGLHGLDADASARAHGAIDTSLARTQFWIHLDTYFLVSPARIEQAVRAVVAVDDIHVEKKFPHTVIVTAHEIPVRALVVGKNGSALVSDDGRLVRWNVSTSTAQLGNGWLVLTTDAEITHTALLDQIVDSTLMHGVNAVRAVAPEFLHGSVQTVHIASDGSDRMDVVFERGMVMVCAWRSDMQLQIKKATAAVQQFNHATSVDVRFGDKVFLSR